MEDFPTLNSDSDGSAKMSGSSTIESLAKKKEKKKRTEEQREKDRLRQERCRQRARDASLDSLADGDEGGMVAPKRSKSTPEQREKWKIAYQLKKERAKMDSSMVSLNQTVLRVDSSSPKPIEPSQEEAKREKERLKKQQQRTRNNPKKINSADDIASTPSTSNRFASPRAVTLPTPSTQLSNDLDILNIGSEQESRGPKRVYAFPKASSTPKKPRKFFGRKLDESLDSWMSRRDTNAGRSFHNQYLSKNSSYEDEPMLDEHKNNLNDDQANAGNLRDYVDDSVEMVADSEPELNRVEQPILTLIGKDDLSELSWWRAARKRKHDYLRANLPALSQRVTRIMNPAAKDFTKMRNAVPPLNVLPPIDTCIRCGALTYTYNCCSKGRVQIPPPRPPPPYIKKLLTGNEEVNEHFRTEVVKYNNAFSIGSIGYDRETSKKCLPYVRVHGSFHYQLAGSSLPPTKTVPLCHQLYKYDVNEATRFRTMNPKTGNAVMPNILRNLQVVLEQENYLIKQYKTGLDIATEMAMRNQKMKNVLIVLRAPHELNYQGIHHPGTLSRPRKEVQSMLYTTEPDGGPGKMGMQICHRQFGGKIEMLNYWNSLIDPVSYPLLFPYGNSGFKRGEYKLDVDYVSNVGRVEELVDDYPFEGLNDEMELGVEAIDYHSARAKYKVYCREIGEEVSASENEEDEDEAGEIDKELDVDNENDDMNEFNGEGELFEEIGSEDEGGDPYYFFKNSSDEEDDSNTDRVKPSEPEKDDEVNDSEILTEKMIQEWKKREAVLERGVLEKERKLLIKNEKLRQFKEICLQKRDESNFFTRMFKDPLEIRRVLIDLSFIERKRVKEQDDLYYHAGALLGMGRSEIDYRYDGDMAKLQRDIDNEIECLCADKNYRCDEPLFRQFRENHLDPNQFDDNVGSDYDDPNDVVQTDVRVKMPKDKTKKEIKPVVCGKGKRKNVSRTQHALHQLQVRDPSFHPGYTLGYAFEISNDKVGSTAWYRSQFEKAMAQMDYTGKPDLFITMTGNPEWKEITENLLPNTDWHSNPILVNDVFHLKMQELLDDIVDKELFGPVVSYCYSIEFQKRGMPHMHLLVTLKAGYKLDTSDKIDKYIKATIPADPDPADPDFELKKRFRKNVTKHMLHTACIGKASGEYCQMRSGSSANKHYTRCTKHFPVPFNDHTSTVDGGKVVYHRPDDNVVFEKTVNRSTTVIVDNQWVIPYNPFLLNKYDCHINVEAGFDKALAQFIESSEVDDGAAGQPPRTTVHRPIKKKGASKENPLDQIGVLAPRGLKATNRQWFDIKNRIHQELRRRNMLPKKGEKVTAYDEAFMVECFRQITASEATWIIQGYYLSGLSHNVIDLSVHEEFDMPVFYRAGEEEKMREKVDADQYKSPFKAWLDLNGRDANARKYTYDEIPLHYTFEITPTSREWRPYKVNMSRNIARVRPVSPRYLERFAIRLLSLNQRGPRNYRELRTVNGREYATNHDAAKAAGLMDNQMEFELCLEEAIHRQFPNRLRVLFATMLLFGGVQDPTTLWKTYEEHFYDVRLKNNKDRARNAALFHIEYILSEHGTSLSQYQLPSYDRSMFLSQEDQDYAIDGGLMFNPRDDRAEADKMVAELNPDQKIAFDTIMKAVESNGMDVDGNCFFLQGSGGCGKTYVYRTIYHRLQSLNISVSMIATTGIAATLLINGTTAHRKFQLPLNCKEKSTSSMKLESDAAKDLRQTTVIIIDESTMASKFVFNAIDKLLREIMNKPSIPFGGKIMLLGGDWKQLLPVVAESGADNGVFHTLKSDELWLEFKVLTLTENMRAKEDRVYSITLENVGNGMVNGVIDSNVRLDPKCIVQTIDEVIDFIYHNINSEPDSVINSCILASLNAETCEINEKVLDMLPGETRTYTAIDTPKDGIGMQVPPEYFRNDMPSGLPPHELNLKVGAIVILLRNLNVSRGLCNGSRLRVIGMYDHFVECELLTTDYAGSIVWICKTSVDPPSGSGDKNSKYSRFQLPLRLAYAMTINKSQGQTFDRVGIVLKNNVFAHGQLYVALSRARQSAKVRLYSASRVIINGRAVVSVKNKVERSVLEPIPEGSLIDPDYVEPDLVYAIEEIDPYVAPRSKPFHHDHSQSVVFEKLQKTKNVLPKPKKQATVSK